MITENGKKELKEIAEYYSGRPGDEMYELDSILDDMVKAGDIDDKDEAENYVKENVDYDSEYMEVFTEENTGGNFTKEQIKKMNDKYNNEYKRHGQEVEFDKVLFEFHLDDAKKMKSFVKDYHNGDNDKLTRML